MTELEREFWYD